MFAALPERVHLPSGRVVRLSSSAAGALRRANPVGASEPLQGFSETLAVLGGSGVLSEDAGSPIDPLTLPLRDAHVLRALFIRAGYIGEAPGAYTCQNCDAPFETAPSRLLEVAPFVDGELTDPDLDAPFAFDKAHPIPALRAGRTVANAVRLAPRTVEESLALWRAAGSRVLRLTPALVAAMGITALGRERRSSVIAAALARAPARVWRAIADLYHDAHYSARLVAVVRCRQCGARNDVDVPQLRELAREPCTEPAAPDGFPDLDAFERQVRNAARSVYRARGVQNIDLFIDSGVPDCDDGGDPLLGSYTPAANDHDAGIAHPPEIRLYYRSFEAEARADPSFDLTREIRETIDHEVTHHLHWLAGSDPLDDEEQKQIAQEQMRLVGRSESIRRARRGVATELAGFVRTTWPMWLLLLLAAAIGWCESSDGAPRRLGGYVWSLRPAPAACLCCGRDVWLTACEKPRSRSA